MKKNIFENCLTFKIVGLQLKQLPCKYYRYITFKKSKIMSLITSFLLIGDYVPTLFCIIYLYTDHTVKIVCFKFRYKKIKITRQNI